VEHYPSGDPETFQIVLDLYTGKVTIQFQTVSDASEAVVGVENADGSEATQYAYADPVLIADSVAVDFYPMFSTPPPTGDPGELAGAVTDADSGLPLDGATVEALAFTTGELFSYQTGATGAYSDTLCADWYTLTVSAPGYHASDPTRATVVSGTLTTQDFVLEPMGADLWLDKTGPLTTTPGAYLTYTLSFGSTGPQLVPQAEVWDALPQGLTYVTSTGTYSPAAHAVGWQWADVSAGFSMTVELVVQVSPTITVGQEVCNEAQFVALGEPPVSDPEGGNNLDTACTYIGHQPSYRIYLPLVSKSYSP
jgi:uncharacterized repeat protein (TIGR01451 family)